MPHAGLRTGRNGPSGAGVGTSTLEIARAASRARRVRRNRLACKVHSAFDMEDTDSWGARTQAALEAADGIDASLVELVVAVSELFEDPAELNDLIDGLIETGRVRLTLLQGGLSDR